jgi:hypothetical protein
VTNSKLRGFVILLLGFHLEVVKWTGDLGQTLNRLYLDKFLLGQLIGKLILALELT